MYNPFRKFSSWLLGNVQVTIKAVIFIVVAIAAGHLCDDYFQSHFPIFKIVFGLVGLMIFSILLNNEKSANDGGED